jgi:phosphoribosylformylglycinamidine cyclo-ligase
MYQVFNCGHRLELYIDKSYANEIINISKSFSVDAKIIGKVEDSASKKLTINSEFGHFVY